MDESGVDMFRINMSHTEIDEFEAIVKQLQKWTQKPICPDTEGAQIRSVLLGESLHVNQYDCVKIVNSHSLSNLVEIGIIGGDVGEIFSCGDLIKIDFNGVLIQVIKTNKLRL